MLRHKLFFPVYIIFIQAQQKKMRHCIGKNRKIIRKNRTISEHIREMMENWLQEGQEKKMKKSLRIWLIF